MKVGQVVECDFGLYKPDKHGKHHADGHIPPEMIKKRLAVLLNVKLGTGFVVVPLSSTQDVNKEQRGYHVKIDPAFVPQTAFWTPCDRWAKAELMQYVSLDRLFTMRDNNRNYVKRVLPRDLVADIQRAVMTVIGGAALLRPIEPPVQPPIPADPGNAEIA